MSRHQASQRRVPEPEEDRWLEAVRESLLAGGGPVTPLRVAAAVRAAGLPLGTVGALDAVDRVQADLLGLGPLQELVKDPSVTDIFVNAPDEVWVDRGAGAERTPVRFAGEGEVRALAARLVASGGRRLDDGAPCVDVRMPGGYRVHAVLPPVSTSGTLLSVRVRREDVFTLEGLVDSGTLNGDLALLLAGMLRRRLNFLVSGATGSGKTTLLSALLGLSNPSERLVLIEDSAELNPAHPHVVGLQSRHRNVEGEGAVDLAELVRQAMRMRPDRLIVGECRGAEVRELLTALNTGHSGGCGTIHANSSAAVPARLAALGALAGLGREALALQAASALDAVVHIERTVSGRRVVEIGTVQLTGQDLAVATAVRRSGNQLERGLGWDALERRLKEPEGA